MFARPLVNRGGQCYNGGMELILCCDYGLDDAAATVDALSHAKQDGYTRVSIVAIGGNVPPSVALRNAQKLTAQCDFEMPPLTIVDTCGEAQPSVFLKEIHGDDGMGSLFEDVPAAPALPFAAWLEGVRGAYDLLSLGPATLVPRILERGELRRLVLMGGNIAETPNYRGYEFNHALDRAAFTAVTQRYAHVAVTMDTCRHPLLNVQNADLSGGGLQRRIVARAREMTFVSGEKGCYIWDDMAVKALRHPDWFQTYAAVDCDGNRLTVAKYVFGKPYPEILEQ